MRGVTYRLTNDSKQLQVPKSTKTPVSTQNPYPAAVCTACRMLIGLKNLNKTVWLIQARPWQLSTPCINLGRKLPESIKI